MQDLRITIVQSDLHWQMKDDNLEMLSGIMDGLDTDIVILPEMFNTGFVVEPEGYAEGPDGKTFRWMLKNSARYGFVIAGSFIIVDSGNCYNRFYWVEPDGNFRQYDKRHLFRMAGEDKRFSPGISREVIDFNGWKVCPQICYDLRFPVWSKNRYAETGFEFDLLIYVANWPEIRNHAWKSLLISRAIENQCYVAGVNRIGRDGNGIDYSGDSVIIDPQGYKIYAAPEGRAAIQTITLSFSEMQSFRNKLNEA